MYMVRIRPTFQAGKPISTIGQMQNIGQVMQAADGYTVDHNATVGSDYANNYWLLWTRSLC